MSSMVSAKSREVNQYLIRNPKRTLWRVFLCRIGDYYLCIHLNNKYHNGHCNNFPYIFYCLLFVLYLYIFQRKIQTDSNMLYSFYSKCYNLFLSKWMKAVLGGFDFVFGCGSVPLKMLTRCSPFCFSAFSLKFCFQHFCSDFD